MLVAVCNLFVDLLVDLLRGATKEQLFLFNGHLYEQTDGVAMGSPSDPYWPMFSCLALRKPWSVKARCPLTIGDMWTTL